VWADGVKEFPAQFESLIPTSVGKEPIVPYFHEARREDMEKKAANKLILRQFHNFDHVMILVVFPLKANLLVYGIMG
jgi:hypothetical protein